MKNNKTNWSMKAASVLMTLTLISSCFLGGTFSKYVVTNSASNSARVAKFGVKIETSDFDNLFSAAYDDTGKKVNWTGSNATATVNAEAASGKASSNLIAPGTYYEAENNYAYKVTGTPEVAVRVKIKPTVDVTGFTDDYIPIIFKIDCDKNGTTTTTYLYSNKVYSGGIKDIKVTEFGGTTKNITITTTGTTTTSFTDFTDCADLKSELEKCILNSQTATTGSDYNPNTDLSTEIGTLKISWYWPFEYDDTDQASSFKNKTDVKIYTNDNTLGTAKEDDTTIWETNDLESSKDTGLGDLATTKYEYISTQLTRVEKILFTKVEEDGIITTKINSNLNDDNKNSIKNLLDDISEVLGTKYSNITNSIKTFTTDLEGNCSDLKNEFNAIKTNINNNEENLEKEYVEPKISISFAASVEQID